MIFVTSKEQEAMCLDNVRLGNKAASICGQETLVAACEQFLTRIESFFKIRDELPPRKVGLGLPSILVCNKLLLQRVGKVVTWLILPVVICLSQRLSHASLSINKFVL